MEGVVFMMAVVFSAMLTMIVHLSNLNKIKDQRIKELHKQLKPHDNELEIQRKHIPEGEAGSSAERTD